MSDDHDVIRLDPTRLHDAIAATSRAFWPDPMFGFFSRNGLDEHTRMPAYIRAVMDDALRFGEVDAVVNRDRIAATASWLPPGAAPRSTLREFRVTARCASALVRGRNRMKALDILNEMDKLHPSEPHWYLAAIGVDPKFQGRGIGSALLRSRFEVCDSARLPVYLETQKPENVPYYERFGFAVLHTVAKSGCPTLWGMWRDPRSE